MSKSFEGKVIADGSGQWVGNQLRFATEPEAKAYVDDLAMRWTAVREWKAFASDDPVTHRWDADRRHAVSLEEVRS